MTKKKPVVVVTRRLPELVETRMRELFDARLNLEDKPMSQAEIVEAMREADVIVPTITDHINAGDDRAGGRADAPDRQFRQRRRPYRRDERAQARHHRHQHAGRHDRRHGRHDDGAHPGDRAPARRGRARHPERPVGRLDADLDARAPDHRQAARRHRHGPHRPGARKAGARLRHVDPLSQPPPGGAADRGIARGDLLESLDQMLARMDFVSIHCPHTPGTYHLLSARRLKHLRPTRS